MNSDGTTIPNLYPVIGVVDTLGNVLELKHYVLAQGCQNAGADMLCTSDGGLITWGFGEDFFALKVDSNLAPIWSKSFSTKGGIQFIKELPNGDLLAGFNMDTAGAVVARLDADGNFLWCKSYVRPGGMVHDALIESDSSYIITGFTDSLSGYSSFIPLPPNYHPELFMLKLDGSGTVQWCKGYDSTPFLWYARPGSRIERVADDSYVVMATMGEPGYNFYYRPCLMKLDGNGDTLWTRAYGENGYSYQARNLSLLDDEGLLISGQIRGNFAPNPASGMVYLLKTDSMGHASCHEQYIPIQVTDLFPTDSSFTLTSVDGAAMQPASVTDTILPPIVVYDGCTFATGLPPAAFYRLQSKVKVYPNPTTGRITVQFADPLMAKSFYSVYDTMARLLYQRPLLKGQQTEEVDLSRFGKGTYVIKFTSPEGVCYERVVLSP